jgi:hypothetical protein
MDEERDYKDNKPSYDYRRDEESIASVCGIVTNASGQSRINNTP